MRRRQQLPRQLARAHPGKVLLKMAAIRLSAYCEVSGIPPEAQWGYRLGRLTADMMYVVCRLQGLTSDDNLALHVCFIDFQ